MSRATRIPAQDHLKVEVVESEKKKFSLEEIQKHVGGWVERLRLYGEGAEVYGTWMWCDEEAILKGLPVNKEATRLLAASYPGKETQQIHGEVLIIEGRKES